MTQRPKRSNSRALFALLIAACLALTGVVAIAHRRAGTDASPPIIGGTFIPDDAASGLAYILIVRKHGAAQCTGTVIASTVVLTAGHCVEEPGSRVLVAPGGYTVMTMRTHRRTSYREVSRVVRVVVYPGFARNVNSSRPDAALLFLSRPTRAALMPVSQPSSSPPISAVDSLLGWRTDYGEQRLPTQIVRARTDVQTTKWCHAHVPLAFHSRFEICTLEVPGERTGVCRGDSGGPLVLDSSSHGFTEIGIASRIDPDGPTRCSTRGPDTFTSVTAISPWLKTWLTAPRQTPR